VKTSQTTIATIADATVTRLIACGSTIPLPTVAATAVPETPQPH
jgi:hypothetical protein